MSPENETIAQQVKKAILRTYGHTNMNWRKPKDGKNISDYNFTMAQITMLAGYLSEIAGKYKPDARVYVISVEDCKTVQDCIDVVLEGIAE